MASRAAASAGNTLAEAAQRPLLRGALHAVAAALAGAGAAALLLIAASPRAYVGAAIFASSLALLYSTSAIYHRVTWRPALRRIVKRVDHAMIFVLIAGTYTPFCLLVLSDAWGITMLSVVWGVAGAGMLLKVAWPEAPRWLSVPLYLVVGWLAVVAAPQLLDRLSGAPIAMLLTGGVLYSLGGVVYAVERPNPWPRVFGYHEVFHALVVAGSAVHYALVAAYLLPR
ncbi:MAG TPA: hemolysin III family protein [Dehalococcoidia bacterium]|nr:hemolysin III family protein [Dehalococcoidia bacterium]